MKTLIIYSHPNTQGHCSYILEIVEKKLQEKNTEYEIIDLYKTNYDPILHENELYTSGNKYVDTINLEFQEKIKSKN